jgi:hypothetical protein
MSDNIEKQLKIIGDCEKFVEEDSQFLEKRDEFAESIGHPDLWSVIDQFGTYVGIQTLATRLAVYEILKQTLDVPGHVLEFGVWNGSNLLFMAKILALLRPNSPKKLIGFDNFEGLKNFQKEDGEDAKSFEGGYRGSEETIRAAISLFGMENWVHLIKGDACKTIPEYERCMPNNLVSFAYIDFDLYAPSKAALEYLANHLSHGGIIAFDQGLSHLWPGEGQAMIEFLSNRSGNRFKMISPSFARQPNLYIVKVQNP